MKNAIKGALVTFVVMPHPRKDGRVEALLVDIKARHPEKTVRALERIVRADSVGCRVTVITVREKAPPLKLEGLADGSTGRQG